MKMHKRLLAALIVSCAVQGASANPTYVSCTEIGNGGYKILDLYKAGTKKPPHLIVLDLASTGNNIAVQAFTELESSWQVDLKNKTLTPTSKPRSVYDIDEMSDISITAYISDRKRPVNPDFSKITFNRATGIMTFNYLFSGSFRSEWKLKHGGTFPADIQRTAHCKRAERIL